MRNSASAEIHKSIHAQMYMLFAIHWRPHTINMRRCTCCSLFIGDPIQLISPHRGKSNNVLLNCPSSEGQY
jgi:hypothetical protein